MRHVSSALSGYRSDFAVYHGERNAVWTFVKNMPAPLLWLYLPQHLALNLAALLFYPWRGQGRVVVARQARCAARTARRARVSGARCSGVAAPTGARCGARWCAASPRPYVGRYVPPLAVQRPERSAIEPVE